MSISSGVEFSPGPAHRLVLWSSFLGKTRGQAVRLVRASERSLAPELRARACYCFAMRSTGYRTITQRPLQLLAGPLILETKNAVSRLESFSRCLSSEGPRATQRRTDLRKAREMASLEHEFACGTKSSHRCVTERSTHLLGSARQQPASSAAVRACAPSWPFDRARGLVRAQAVRRHPRAAVVPWLSASCQLTARSRVRAWQTLGG